MTTHTNSTPTPPTAETSVAEPGGNRLTRAVDRLSTGRLAIATLLAGVWMVSGLMIANAWFAKSDIGEELFAVQLAFDPDVIRDQYARLVAQDTLDTYVQTQLLDYLFITGLAAFGWLLHRLIARAHVPGSPWHRIARFGGLLVVTSAAFDALENLVAFAMLADTTGFPDVLAPIYSTLAAVKWTIAFVGGPLLLVQLGAVVARRTKRGAQS